MSLFSVDLPHRFMFEGAGEWDDTKQQKLEDYLNELSTSIEDMFRRLQTRQTDTAESPTADNLLMTDADGGLVDSGVKLAELCYLAGNQTISGIKTFSVFPIGPSAAPTTDYQLCNKKYADDVVGAIGSFLPLTGGTMAGDVDMAQYEILQLVIENRTSDPGSPVAGQVWFRTDL